MWKVGALLLVTIAVVCMSLAIVGMVTGRPSDRVGWLLRVAAVVAFAGAVVLTSVAHH